MVLGRHGIEGPAEDEATLPAARLARWIGKPCVEWTQDDLVGVVRDRGIRLLSLVHVAGDGSLRALDFAPRSEEHLRRILAGGERADGSSLFRGLGIRARASDISLRPRLRSAFIDPFSPVPTLAIMCHHLASDGLPLPESPDTIVRSADQRLQTELGIRLLAHGEVEYYLGKQPDPKDVQLDDDRGYHVLSPFVFGEGMRREAIVILADCGVPVKYGHAEVGVIGPADGDGWLWEQHEVELALTDLPEAADAVLLTRWVLETLARRRGMRCSFDPIMSADHVGNGLHFHFSPFKDGRHLGGRAENGHFEPAAAWLIAGLVQLGAGLMAFGNRSPGSFVRLKRGGEAPRSVSWGAHDRRALVRLPLTISSESGELITPPTIEFRLPDGSALAHLLLAAVAQSVLVGRHTPDIDDVLQRTAATQATPAGGSGVIPTDFAQVAQALTLQRAALEQGGVFLPRVIDHIIESLGS